MKPKIEDGEEDIFVSVLILYDNLDIVKCQWFKIPFSLIWFDRVK